jgi:peptide/nickel transport system ATP-binding protein
MSEALLSVRDLRVGFATQSGRVQAVDGVSFDLEPGEVLAIVGESGSGKSVTAQTLNGLTRFSANALVEGSVRLGDLEVTEASESQLQAVRGERIGMVFQDPMSSLNPVYRVGAQIAEAIRAHRPEASKDEARERAIELLDSVGIPNAADRIDDYPHQFSGGMRQRAMIAIALALDPEILIADEPTTALDVTVQAQILALLERLNRERNLATILITHDLGVVAEVADRVLVMHEGRIVERGSLDDVFYTPKDPYTRSLLGAVLRLDEAPPLRAARESEPLLEIADLVVQHGTGGGLLRRGRRGVRAVDGVSLALRSGETLGLVGESGCGKTTLCRAALQLIAPDSGSVRFEGREIAGLSQRQMRPLRREMQLVFQDPGASLNPRKRAGQIVAAPLKLHGSASGAELRSQAIDLLERVGLGAEHYDRFPHEFSGGQRQRIGIARALALRPKLIVADEPVSALDVTIRAQILDLLAEMQEDFGLTYLFVAHDIGVVRHVSDRIAVMNEGRIVEEGPADRVCEQPSDPFTEKLLAAVPIPDPHEARARRQTVGSG